MAAPVADELFPARKPITHAQITAGIQAALDVQRRAVTFGKRPFAAVLLGPDNATVLLSHQSVDQVNHAEVRIPFRAALPHKSVQAQEARVCFSEANTTVCNFCGFPGQVLTSRDEQSSLARLAYSHYTKSFLWSCTLVSTWEPCAMCTSTIYWAHIGRIIYAGSNDQLYELTGPGNRENFTMDWHCRDILKGCPQKDIEVIGPLEEEGKLVMEEADRYWRKTRT